MKQVGAVQTSKEARTAVLVCDFPGCNNVSTSACGYCGRRFCGYHSEAKMATNLRAVSSIDRDENPELWAEINESWQTRDGHACTQYTEQRLKHYHNEGSYRTTYRGGTIIYDQFSGTGPQQSNAEDGRRIYERSSQATRLPPVIRPSIEKLEESEEMTPHTLKKHATVSVLKPLLLALLVVEFGLAVFFAYGLVATNSGTSPSLNFSNNQTGTRINATHYLPLLQAGASFPINTFPDNYKGVEFTIPSNTENITISGGATSTNSIQIILLNQSEFSNFTRKGRLGFSALSKANSSGDALSFLDIRQPGTYYLLFFNPYNTQGTYTNVTITRSFVAKYHAITTTISTTSTIASTATTSILANVSNSSSLSNNVEVIVNADPSSFSSSLGGGGYYKPGTNITLSIYGYSNTQYSFTGWSCTGAGCYQGPNPHPTIMVNNTITETAHFETTGNSPSTSVSGTGQGTGSTSTSVNDAWVAQFFAAVSSARGHSYSSCTSLSNFAKVRFNTMSANYGISHYGYNQDFQSYYGTIYNTYFGEEVFYPSGYTPSGYVSDIQSSAPLHWQLMASGNFSYYGYDIQNGPNYEIYGPNGGYSLCPVTEIPGPNINVSQYFASYGCSVVVSNQTWFVIELASACP